MKILTVKGAHKLKRRKVNRAVRKARRDSIGGNVKTPRLTR
ncbi:hypothetical protein CZ797_04280 [Pseudoalteromonas sp. JB197]|nr:hypothetical protein CZ797_04280 [Pseudoalteromonas sp. JB197]